MSKPVKLIETVYSSDAKIDREAGVIRRVKVLGRESANGRTYSDQAMHDAARLYEGAEVNIDHDRKEPNRERGLLEGFGVLRGVTEESDGIYSDLHYLKSHPATEVFLERAERFPDKVGLSHNADGKANRHGKKLIVESIAKVNSVDVVRNPATNKGLFESKDQTMPTTVKEILESIFPETFAVCGLLEMDGMGAMAVDAPAATEANSEEQVKTAFRAMVMAAFDDEALDTKATAKRIKTILSAYDKLSGSSSAGETAPDAKEEKPMSESKEKTPDPLLTKLAESVERIEKREADREKREKARSILAEFQVTEDAALLESLVKLPAEADMRALVEREAKVRPRSFGTGSGTKPLIESRASAEKPVEYPKDVKSMAAALRR